jgi:hypothetical protein
LGTGISEGGHGSTTIPPGANGIWSFSLGVSAPSWASQELVTGPGPATGDQEKRPNSR